MEAQIAPPVLSTPESHIFEDPTPPSFSANLHKTRLTDAEIDDIYEVERTANEILAGGWKRVALQFPDHMLGDATRVFESLERELVERPERRWKSEGKTNVQRKQNDAGNELETDFSSLALSETSADKINGMEIPKTNTEERIRLYILADTSYGSCCVDEIAAEHVDAEVVVHYGRSCLSPTARLPVIYVFTSHVLDLDAVVAGFEKTFGEEKDQKVILMADITYHNHIPPLAEKLRARGWLHLLAPEVIHDPESVIPNRKVPEEIREEELKGYKMFHLSEPPNALVLTLYSRLGEFFVYPTTSSTLTSRTQARILDTTQIVLRRRYALLTHLATVPIVGILINTLSIKSYLSTLSSLTSLLQKHGKKHYTFVVGKVNAAKMANFAEIGGWVVVGCWEGSLFDSSTAEGFFKGVVTPFELGMALSGEGWRVRGGEWKGSLEEEPIEETSLTDDSVTQEMEEEQAINASRNGKRTESKHIEVDTGDQSSSESESEPPEYDFRTGRYITSSRPMRSKPISASSQANKSSNALTKRSKNTDLAMVNGVLSPGAEFLRSQRTWAGLGSDFDRQEGDGEGEGGVIEEGRSGVARGYVVGDEGVRH